MVRVGLLASSTCDCGAGGLLSFLSRQSATDLEDANLWHSRLAFSHWRQLFSPGSHLIFFSRQFLTFVSRSFMRIYFAQPTGMPVQVFFEPCLPW